MPDFLTAETAIRLGEVALAFGRVNRITYHPDGSTPESDTDHTVMLAMIACAAATADPTLDLGLVAQYAIIHDLVEVYAGDTPTLNPLDADGRADKAAREEAALDRLSSEFSDSAPWLIDTLMAYEAQVSREARFVRAVDKAMPKITHALNRGATPRGEGLDRVALARNHAQQVEVVGRYARDLPGVMDLLRGLMDSAEEAMA